MVDRESADGSASDMGRSWSGEHLDWDARSQRSSITVTSFGSELSLSTDLGEDSAERFPRRRYSELSWPEALKAQGLNKRLEVIWEELDKALVSCDLRQVRPKLCPTVLNVSKSSLRLRRTAGLH